MIKSLVDCGIQLAAHFRIFETGKKYQRQNNDRRNRQTENFHLFYLSELGC